MSRKVILLLVMVFLLSSCTLPILPQAEPVVEASATVESLEEGAVGAEEDKSLQDEAQVCPTCPPVNCPATSTPLPPTATFTNTPAFTPTSTNTVTPLPATATATATVTRVIPSPTVQSRLFNVQANSPVYLQNFANNKGCSWMGVAGQAFNREGKPIKNLVVVVEGFIGETPVDQVALTGMAPAYGTQGYEITLASQVIATNTSLFITLYDLAGTPLTYPVMFNTFADCKKNLILINFQERKD